MRKWQTQLPFELRSRSEHHIAVNLISEPILQGKGEVGRGDVGGREAAPHSLPSFVFVILQRQHLMGAQDLG